jgi:hypothetical protein
MSARNHFFHRGPIRDQAYFFGRQRETAQLFDLLSRGQSVSISGQRRLGKTTLLLHALAPEVGASHGLDPAQTRWVYLDGGMLDGLGEDAIYGAIDRGIQERQLENAPYTALAEHIRALAAQNLRLIVVFDEFEIFAENAQLQPRLFNRLRGLSGQFPVQYVIASKESLARLSYANAAIVSSSFFNIFAPFRVSLFGDQEAAEMLTVLSSRGGSPFKPDTIAFLLELVGPHPHFLQVAGYHAFELQRRGSLSAEDRSEVRVRTLQELEGHLEYYWRDLSAQEQYTLAALPVTAFDSRVPAMSHLSDCGLLCDQRYLGSALADFVSRQNVAGVLRHPRFVMDEQRHLLAVDGKPAHLTPTEFSALRLLLQNSGRILTPEEIEAALWPDEIAPDPERARGLMKKLRIALGDAGDAIVTQRGQGYSLA